MFYNISNHPSDKWGDKQTARAKQLSGCGGGEDFFEEGSIKDIPFPNVSPDYDPDAVFWIAHKTLETLPATGERHDDYGNHLGVHCAMVQGEFTLTYALVTELHRRGFHVYAATTERIVDEADGVKTARFEFKRYRLYRPYDHRRAIGAGSPLGEPRR